MKPNRWLTGVALIGLLAMAAGPSPLGAACIRGDCVDGRGVYTWPDGTRYEGRFNDTRFDGQGIYTWPDGRRYEGEFRGGQRQGQGTHSWPNGARYQGGWQAGRQHGLGTYTWPDGARYEGQWADGVRSGLGIYTFADGHTESGQWQDGVLIAPLPSLEVARRLAAPTVPASAQSVPAAVLPPPPSPATPSAEPDGGPSAGSAIDPTLIDLQQDGQIVEAVGTTLTAGAGKTLVGRLSLGLIRPPSPGAPLKVSLMVTNTSGCRMTFRGWIIVGEVLERIVDWPAGQDLAPGASRQAEAAIVLPRHLGGLTLRFKPEGTLRDCP